MTPPRKKVYSGPTERMQASRERRKEAGQRQVAIWLTEDAITKLDRLAAREETDRSGFIQALIKKAR